MRVKLGFEQYPGLVFQNKSVLSADCVAGRLCFQFQLDDKLGVSESVGTC